MLADDKGSVPSSDVLSGVAFGLLLSLARATMQC